jgi:lipopolysaccharide biosynthesis regulator YciM
MKILGALFFLASIAGAWLAGTRMRTQEEESPRKTKLPRDYLIGLNFLLNDETDKAVDIFIKMLEVDSETVETHLAVGKLFRRRGEVDRAIRIHQNLIARPQLESVYREQAMYELGQDYLSAGVLDRAERIFTELSSEKNYSPQALLTLIDIYEQEKSWQKALDTAVKYQAVTKKNMYHIISHYYCELAEQHYNKNELHQAENLLENALAVDKSCVRASLLYAKVHMRADNYELALKRLKKIRDQNTNYLSESVDLIASCYEKLQQEDELIAYFKKLMDEYPRVPVVLILAERIRKWKGDKVAANFVADYVRRYPSLRGLHLFVNLYISNVEGRAKEDMQILQNLMKKVLANKPDYQCTSCGFSGRTLHWQCPGCKEWSSIRPMYSLEEGVA